MYFVDLHADSNRQISELYDPAVFIQDDYLFLYILVDLHLCELQFSNG